MRARQEIFVTTIVLALCAATIASAEEFTESLRLDGEALVLTNLIGRIELRSHAAPGFQVEVRVRGADASRDRIRIDTDEGRLAAIDIVFPLEDEREYVYPELGRGETSFSFREGGGDHRGWLRRFLGTIGANQVHVRGSGSGLEVWADVEILVPEGGTVEVRHGAGDILASGVHGELLLDSESGRIEAEEIDGSISADTGSGEVIVRNVNGEVRCDTGSGSVALTAVRGPHLLVDTGSGDVTLDEVACEELVVDTGSGSVEGRGLSVASASVDTGSGGVRLEFTTMGPGDFLIDTGSGGIDLIVPADASAEFVASTGNGRIDIEVEGAEIHRRDDGDASFRIGAGESQVELDTGSGQITVGN